MDRTKAPVFVVGSPRSGTTLMYHTILSSGNFAIYQAESDVFNSIAPAFGDLKSLTNRRRLLKVWLKSDYFQRTGLAIEDVEERVLVECRNAGDFLRIFMELMAAKQGVERWADNTPTHLLYMHEIKAAIPDAIFIHMIRDGRDVAVSMNRMDWGGYRFPWDRDYGLLVSGLRWEWLVRRGRETGSRLSSDYLEVRYEQLVKYPKETLKKVGAFLQHDLNYERIKQTAIGTLRAPNSSFDSSLSNGCRPDGHWRRFAGPDSLRLDALLTPLLRELGYPSNELMPLDFTTRRLKIFYPRYNRIKHAIKRSRFSKFMVNKSQMQPGALNRALSRWEGFSISALTTNLSTGGVHDA
jgi:hypothetical protein